MAFCALNGMRLSARAPQHPNCPARGRSVAPKGVMRPGRGGPPLTYALAFEQKPKYLHVVVTGFNSRETVLRYWDELIRECKTRDCFRVLVEERLDGPRLGTMEVFRLANEGATRHQGVFRALAYVDVNAVGDRMHFAEDVGVNRGVPVRVFDTVAEAEKWLLRQGESEQIAAARSPPALPH